MPISTIVHKQCPHCPKVFIEESRIDFGDSFFVSGQCGHCITIPKEKSTSYDSLLTSDGKTFRPYQVEGVKFAESANGRCLIADEQGLGKTWQGVGYLKLHLENLPAIIVTKTTLTHQWYKEIQRIIHEQKLICQVIKSGKERAIQGMDVYICSWDMLKNEDLFEFCITKPNTIIFDECQAIKNHLSGRAKAAQRASVGTEHIIALSGTPIKNNAGEYFTILNILQPTRFPHFQRFLDEYCDSYEQGMYGAKVGGLRDIEKFKQATSDFIIRRTRREAAPEIPEVDRQFFHVELDKKFNKAYAAALDELEELYYQDEDSSTGTSMIAIMTKLRQITGLSKAPAAVDFTIDFLENEPDKKLVIFAHHHSVVDLLELKLNSWLAQNGYDKCLNLNANLTADKRASLVDDFKDNKRSRILIASTQAAGEGLNLQFCSRAIMLERQWNPANEEQAEGRFARIGQEDNIIVTYMLASETIDEYFTDIVEQKRAIIANTLDGKDYQWDQNSLVKELASVLVHKGKKKWSL